MKIVMTVSSLHSNSGVRGGGMERSVSNLANALANKGHDVSILTLDSIDEPPLYPLAKNVEHSQLALNAPSANKIMAVMRMLRSAWVLCRNIKRRKADVVVAFGGQTCVLTLAGSLLAGVPVVVAERTHPAHFPIGRGWGGLRSFLYPLAAGIVAQTSDIAQWYADNLNARRIATIPNFVSPPSKHTEFQGKERMTAVAAGMLAPVKGFDLLIEAFAKAAPTCVDWDLVIYGEGPDRDALEQRIAEKGLSGRIILPGRVDDLERRFSQADLFVLTSRTEGFPNVLVEAMACGLPPVAFDCPSGPADIIRNAVDGVLVPPEDVDALAAGMREVMEDDAMRASYGRRAREIVDRFSFDRVLGLWTSLLQDAVRKS